MTKLKRDVRVWANRVMMGRARAWVIIEGTKTDAPFYENVMRAAGVERTEIVRAEDLEVDGSSAGGKDHALKLFAALESAGKLSQSNRETTVDVLVFVDRDDDDYTGSVVEHTHLTYTRCTDVEAEIVVSADLPRAVASLHSLSSHEVASVPIDAIAETLAGLWSEWIALRLAAAECEWGDVRFSQRSAINSPLYGPVDEASVDRVCARLRGDTDWALAHARAKAHVADQTVAGNGHLLVKGKWLAGYADWLVRSTLSPGLHLRKVDHQSFIAACLLSLDFGGSWVHHYSDRISAALAA